MFLVYAQYVAATGAKGIKLERLVTVAAGRNPEESAILTAVGGPDIIELRWKVRTFQQALRMTKAIRRLCWATATMREE